MILDKDIEPCVNCGLKTSVRWFRSYGGLFTITCCSCHLAFIGIEDEEDALDRWNDFSHKINNLIQEK